MNRKLPAEYISRALLTILLFTLHTCLLRSEDMVSSESYGVQYTRYGSHLVPPSLAH